MQNVNLWDNPKPRVKQPKVLTVPPPPAPPAAPKGPRYQYFSKPPAAVPVRLGDMAGSIPDGIRASFFDTDRIVEVPCGNILRGPVPKISLSMLADLAPECFATKNFSDAQIRLPAARLATAYRMVTWSEVIEEPPAPEPIIEPEPPPMLEIPAVEPAATGAVDEAFAPPETQSVSAPLPLPEAAAPTVPEVVQTPAAAPAEPAPAIPPRAASVPQTKRPLSILPIFRRKEPEQPAQAEPRTRIEIPKPRAVNPLIPPPAAPAAPLIPPPPAPIADEPEQPLPENTTMPVESGPVDEPAAPVEPEPSFPRKTDAVLIETEHVPGPRARQEIPRQDALQAIFMTEEFLGVERVIELCGGLPGIKSCVLSHGSAVLASHNVPDTIDLVSLSAHAMEMLGAMRETSAKMGIGEVPAVTVHSDKGPITFFNREDVCLLVLHKDRGFVPGVREKLQLVVEELTQANLPLPVSPARKALQE